MSNLLQNKVTTNSTRTRWSSYLMIVFLLVIAGCTREQPEKRFYDGVTLDETALYVSARRWEENGLEWLKQEASGIELRQAQPEIAEDSEITILIHGYHAPEKNITSYFSGLIAHLRNTQKYQSPIIVFDWPSKARYWVELSNDERIAYSQLIRSRHPSLSWEIGQYSADAILARSVGADALITLIKTLSVDKPDIKFNIIAHSMGCYVTLEAFKKNAEAMSPVKTVFWLAADLKNDVLEEPAFARGLSQLDKLHVFYSKHDGVLAYLSGLLHWSAMLGSHGPSNMNNLTENVVTHDLSDSLGTEGVHSKYLEKKLM